MDKLSRNDINRRDDLAKRLGHSQDALMIEHADMVEAIETFNKKIDAHNEIIAEAAGWRDDLVNEIDEYLGGKSDAWQEGDKGQAVTAWKDELEQLDLEPIEPLEIPDMPDLLHVDTLEQMPVEAGS